jgi:asparagine synthase (glutamine-hydrolysing)
MENLAEYLSFRYIHAPRTLLKSIHSVEPGHLVRIQNNQATTEQWYTPKWRHVQDEQLSDDDVREQFNVHLRNAVEKRIEGENIGLLLSGGLDSSAILMHSCTFKQSIPTFTVALDQHPMDESPFAGRVAKVMGAPNTTIRIHSKDVIDTLTGDAFDMGQPMPTPAAAIQYLFFQAVRGQVSILLSGDGGDEILGGRTMPNLVFRMASSKRIGQLPRMAQYVARGMSQRFDRRDWAAPYDNFGQARMIGGSRVFIAPERLNLLTDPGLVRPGIRESVLTRYYQEVDSDPINDILHVWQRGWLVEDSLARADRAASAARLELRYPMLDTNLRHFCAQLAGGQKIRRHRFDFVGKWPLREALLNHLPSKLVYRPKRSMLSPMDQWLHQKGSGFAQDQITAICNELPHIFLPHAVRQLLKEHLAGHANHGLKLWTIILFYLWWKKIH